jgi:predicted TIM-barrel fold metal-dependent hydrolase
MDQLKDESIESDQLPFTNCHTHIFTGDHVPPYLGKTLMPWPFWYFLNIKLIIRLVRSANGKGRLRTIWWTFKTPVDKLAFWWQRQTEHWFVSKFMAWLLRIIVMVLCAVITLGFLQRFIHNDLITGIFKWCVKNLHLQNLMELSWYWKAMILLLGIVLFKAVRNVVKMILFAAFAFLKTIMGGATMELLKRYYNIALLSKDQTQNYIYRVLTKSYPANTRFVVLPMDMDHIKAGKATQDYMEQLDQLRKLKQHPQYGKTLMPFVFADPRRFAKDPTYYDTAVKCLEEEGFSGIKIYPALGYYPFDKHLLKIFLYAAEHDVPVLTHCIRGIIFYRGIKKKNWDHHPIFKENKDGKDFMKLTQFKNIDFSTNFTHPLNYLCLLDPALLKEVLFGLENKKPEDIAVRDELYALYGFVPGASAATSTMQKDLRKLKLCFGHFGGEDEWEKYVEKDRNLYDNKFNLNPDHYDIFINPGMRDYWQQETWYSIIRSIIKNPAYPNVYADISFIIYDEKIISLLKSSLQVDGLKEKILYGTDFYVVRQKGTDKKFWTDIQAHLSKDELNLIAKANPDKFVKLK